MYDKRQSIVRRNEREIRQVHIPQFSQTVQTRVRYSDERRDEQFHRLLCTERNEFLWIIVTTDTRVHCGRCPIDRAPFFWKTILRSLDIDISHQFELALIKRDRNNARKFFRVHDHKNMATRNRRYHEKFRMELVKAQNDKKRGEQCTLPKPDAA